MIDAGTGRMSCKALTLGSVRKDELNIVTSFELDINMINAVMLLTTKSDISHVLLLVKTQYDYNIHQY